MSNRLTFSLASLILIFALAFAAIPVLADTGGPTVTIAKDGTPTRSAYTLKFTFNINVEDFDDEGDIEFRYYDANDGLLGGAWIAATPSAVDGKPREYTVGLNLSSPETGAKGIVVRVPENAATGSTATNTIGSVTNSKKFPLPPVIAVGSLVLSVAENSTQSTATDGKDYVLTLTYKNADDAASDPDPEPRADNITFSPSYLRTAALGNNSIAQATNGSGVYTLNFVHPTGAPDLTIDVDDTYFTGATPAAGVVVPIPDPVTQDPPSATIAISDFEKTLRQFRVTVTLTPGEKSDGSTPAPVKGFGLNNLKITEAGGATVAAEIIAERKNDNSYVAILEYSQLDTLPLTVTIDDAFKLTGDRPSAGVGGDPTTPPVAGAPGMPTDLAAAADQTADTVMLSWIAPTDTGGSAITGYTITQTGQAAASYTATASPFTTPKLAAGDYSFTVAATNATGTGAASAAATATIDDTSTNTLPTLTITTSPPDRTPDPISGDILAVNDDFLVEFETEDADGDPVTVAATISVDPATAATSYSISSATPTVETGVTIMQAKSKVAGQATPAGTVTLTLTPSDALGAGTPATIEVPYDARPFDAADWDQTPPIVVIGDVADDQGSDFEVRFSVTDKGNPSGVTDPAGLDTDIHGNIDGIEVDILGPANAATYYKLTEARPYRVTNSIGDITFASFSMMIKPTRKENRVGIRIVVTVPDRADNVGKHEISVTLGPKDFVPVVTSNPNIISCLTGSTITVTFDRKLAVGEKLTRDEIKLSNPDTVDQVGWDVVPGSITAPSFNATTSETTVQFKVMPKSDRTWLGQTRLRVHIADAAVKDLGANTNAKNKHDKRMVNGVVQKDPDDPRFPLRIGTFTIGPVLEIDPGGYIAVARDKPNPFSPGTSTLALSHLGDTTLTVADKNVRALRADVQGWECMPDLGVLLGIAPYEDKDKDRAASTRLAVTGGGGIIVKESPEHGNFDNPNELVKGTVGISEMMWAIDRSKLFGAASNVEQAQEQWIELHNLNTVPVYVTLFDLVLTEAYSTYGTELDRMSNFNSPTGGRWAIRTDDYKRGRDGDSDYGRDFVAMQKVSIPTPDKNYAHKDTPKGTIEGGWEASKAVYLTKTSDLASSGILLPYGQLNYDFIGTPARPNKLTYTPPGSDVAKATQVPRSPVIFNEIANRINANRYYEWIELRNVTASEVNLRNYNISYITAKGTETTLYEFPNNDNIKIAANGILLLVDTDPKNRRDHPVAIDNPNVKYAVTDFVSNGLPDSGDFVLVLRHPEAHDKAGTAKAKQGTHERVVDIAGYHPDLAEAGAPRYTNLWPFYVFPAPNLMNNRLDVETVHRRQQAVVDGTNTTGDGNHIDKTAFRDANYTGIGYKRSISDIPAHGGTPGYDNGAAKEYNDGNVTASAAPVTISEVMYHTGSSTRLLPQWIELYNSSMTEVVRVEDWTLQLENADDVSIRTPRVSVKLAAKLIQPNQTILIVASSTGNHSDHFPDMRVIDIFGNGLKDKDRLEIDSNVTRRNFKFLSETSFKITLKDKAGKVVDTVGNHGADPAWDLPEEGDNRSSLIRRYDKRVARDGTLPAWSGKGSLGDEGGAGKAAWVLASSSGLYETQDDTYYGNVTDEGSPGYRGGGPLPVSLSKFRPERLDDGSIVVRWITESELNNAGFNILRSETKDGEYTQLNTNLIAGQGTTSERTTYAYPDTSAKPNVVYYYQIQDVSLDGKVTTLRVNRLKGHISAAGKATTTWAELKALQ